MGLEKRVVNTGGLRGLACAFVMGLAVACSSCGMQNTKPMKILGSPPCPTSITSFIGTDSGASNYWFDSPKKRGIALFCRVGHMDLAHVFIGAYWTKFLKEKTEEHLKNNETEFSFKLEEPSKYYVQLSYPENWGNLSEKNKEQIIHDVSIGLGQYFTYTGTTWHEILTLFGYKSSGFFSIFAFPSAFSWEDGFSNVLGCYAGERALRNKEYQNKECTFDESLNLVLDREFKKLGAQPSYVSRKAAESVRGKWFSGDLFSVNMKKRNFDIGLDDGYVTPLLIPGLAECEGSEPLSYPVSNTDILSKYGFSMNFEIEPREWEKGRILKIVYPNKKDRKKRIEPKKHFPVIMDYIKRSALERGYKFDY